MAQLAPDLTRTDDLPVGVQLAWRVRTLIASGELAPGDRLPGVRELAKGTGINVNTARAVYQRLEDDGLIRSEHGTGTFVASGVSSAPDLERLAAEAARSAWDSGIEPRDLARAIYAGSWPDGDDAYFPEADLDGPDLPPDPDEPSTVDWSDERAARRDLRQQIARLEARLASYPGDARAEGEPPHPLLRPKGHVADVGELEAIRDDLMERLKRAEARAESRGKLERTARGRLEEMVADPAAHKWESMSNADLGEPGCTTWDVQPRWGPVGALMNWWRVRVSSGCPLAGAA
jgi:DNA-binding transcriptional regulator YhcF (GntR family)